MGIFIKKNNVLTPVNTYLKLNGNLKNTLLFDRRFQSNSVYFSSNNPFTLSVNNRTKNWDGIIEYSNNGLNWNVWDGSTTLNAGIIDIIDEKYYLFLRGTGNTHITNDNSTLSPLTFVSGSGIFPYVLESGYTVSSYWTLTGTNISANGNIELLLDYRTVILGNHPTMGNFCYQCLFYNNTNLSDVSNLTLPATTLTDRCYDGMFYGCTRLTVAPSLQATTLAFCCYQGMFINCTSLRAMPELPATTLAGQCYYAMFCGCTNLRTVSVLPATELEDKSYLAMFANCISLTTPPALPATIFGQTWSFNEDYYAYMFQGCTSLTAVPSLPATTLDRGCYESMFYGCTSLYISDSVINGVAEEPFIIPSSGVFTNTDTYDQSGMFYGCLGTRSSDSMSGANGESHTYYTQNPPIS